MITPNEQSLAYAMRYVLERNSDAALAMLVRIRTLPGDYIGLQSQLIKHLLQSKSDDFLKTLGELLEKHARLSKRKPMDICQYMFVPGLGIAALAIEAGMVREENLPSSVYLPKEVFSYKNE